MLQSGVNTRDLDVRWVSSLSWYFLNLFGLQSVFIFILGNDNGKFHIHPTVHSLLALQVLWDILTTSVLGTAASQMAQQMSQMNPGAAGANLFQPGQDPDKMFQSEAENLEVLEHWYILDGIEDRLLKGL